MEIHRLNHTTWTCIHVIHIAYTIPGWKFPSHHDVSVSWWKAYYYYGLSVSRHCPQRDIVMKIFQMLRKTEKLGLCIDINALSTVKIIGQIIHCDFTMEDNFGLPCIHVIYVADTIPGWKFPRHHDVSV